MTERHGGGDDAESAVLLAYRLRTVKIAVQSTVLALAAMVLYALLPGHGDIDTVPYVMLVATAAAVAQALSVPLLIAHVLEAVAIPTRVRLAFAGADASRRARAEEMMQEIVASVAAHVKTETLVLSGDPADEIVKLTDARHANLIVMGLHSSELLGPRMGSVTYRVLALTRTLVLAVPPILDAAAA